MLEWIRFGLVTACFAGGLFVLFTALFGTFRLSYSLNRMHAAAMVDTLALLLFVVGAAVAGGLQLISVKFLFILLMLWCTSPVVSHILVKTRYLTDEHLPDHCDIQSEESEKEEPHV